MKIRLLLTTAFFAIISYSVIAQCTASQTASLLISNTTVVSFTDPIVIKVCATGNAYDTTGNSGRIYFLEAGAKLTLKMNSTTSVYMKSGSFLTVGDASSIVYQEIGATITGTPSYIYSCTVVAFPASPACSPTSINEKTYSVDLTSFYPNPAKDNLTVVNDNNAVLHAVVMNVLGQKVKSLTVENGSKNLDVSDLPEGLYYLSVLQNEDVISTKKLIISK